MSGVKAEFLELRVLQEREHRQILKSVPPPTIPEFMTAPTSSVSHNLLLDQVQAHVLAAASKALTVTPSDQRTPNKR